jgi:hypothetical protein
MNTNATPSPTPTPHNADLSSGSAACDLPVSNTTAETDTTCEGLGTNHLPLLQIIRHELQGEVGEVTSRSSQVEAVARRIVAEVQRICYKSDRIQQSGQIPAWQIALARHRIKKCLEYYQLGSRRGRVELHSHLSTIVYRHVAPAQARLGFQGRYTLLEDFLQGFYIEALKAFRREQQLPSDYTPRTRLELAEYMAFCEHYAKRKIALPGHRNQQLIVLRAQSFSRRQPPEATVDIELAVESAKEDDAEGYSRSQVVHQIREQMVADAVDPADSVLRDRVIRELIDYLKAQDQADCIDYFVLKLQDFPAAEIDEILGLSPRQRDYLQQRFKYHAEKFARVHHWQLVHQWLEADCDQNFGMPHSQWEAFLAELTPEQQQLLTLKQTQLHTTGSEILEDDDIAKELKCTPKQVQRRWVHLLELAWQYRNQA